MSVDLSGEITAIATAALTAFAIITAVFAFLAYRKQSQEVNVLQQQLKEQLEATAGQAAAAELQAKQQHMAQASKVFIVHFPWPERPITTGSSTPANSPYMTSRSIPRR